MAWYEILAVALIVVLWSNLPRMIRKRFRREVYRN